MVLDEPKRSGATPKRAVKPATKRKPSSSTPAAKELTIYLDGKFVPEAEAKVSVFDHGLLYGDGIFEGIRFYNGRVFSWRNISSGSGIPPARFASRFR